MRNPWRRAGISSGVVGRVAAISVAAGVLGAAIALPVTGLVGVATRDAANTFNDLKIGTLGQVPTRSEIVDSQGHLIAYYYPNGIYRIPVPYSKIAPVMRNAIVAIEDSRFYLHGAMDPRGTLRAIVNDARNNTGPGRVHAGPAVREERAHPDRAEREGQAGGHRGVDRRGRSASCGSPRTSSTR